MNKLLLTPLMVLTLSLGFNVSTQAMQQRAAKRRRTAQRSVPKVSTKRKERTKRKVSQRKRAGKRVRKGKGRAAEQRAERREVPAPTIQFLASLRQGLRPDCGFYATWCAYAMTQKIPLDDVKILLNDREQFDRYLDLARCAVAEIKKERVEGEGGVVTNIDGDDIYRAVFYVLPNQKHAQESITIIDNRDHMENVIASGHAIPEQLIIAVENFKKRGLAHAVVCNTGRNKVDGHWIAFAIRREGGRTCIFQTNSIGEQQDKVSPLGGRSVANQLAAKLYAWFNGDEQIPEPGVGVAGEEHNAGEAASAEDPAASTADPEADDHADECSDISDSEEESPAQKKRRLAREALAEEIAKELKAGFSRVDYKRAKNRNKNLVGAKLAGADLTGLDLSGTDFTNADLSGAIFKQTNLSNAKFIRTALQGAKFVRSRLTRAMFSNSDLSGAIITCVTTAGVIINKKSRLLQITLSNIDFRGCQFRNSNLSGATIENALFSNITIEDADMTSCQVKVVLFNNCSLNDIDFSEATFDRVAIQNAGCLGRNLGFYNATIKDSVFVGKYLPLTYDEKYRTEGLEKISLDMWLKFLECPFFQIRSAFTAGHSDFRRINSLFIDCDFTLASFNESTIRNTMFKDCNISDISMSAKTDFDNVYFYYSGMEKDSCFINFSSSEESVVFLKDNGSRVNGDINNTNYSEYWGKEPNSKTRGEERLNMISSMILRALICVGLTAAGVPALGVNIVANSI